MAIPLSLYPSRRRLLRQHQGTRAQHNIAHLFPVGEMLRPQSKYRCGDAYALMLRMSYTAPHIMRASYTPPQYYTIICAGGRNPTACAPLPALTRCPLGSPPKWWHPSRSVTCFFSSLPWVLQDHANSRNMRKVDAPPRPHRAACTALGLRKERPASPLASAKSWMRSSKLTVGSVMRVPLGRYRIRRGGMTCVSRAA